MTVNYNFDDTLQQIMLVEPRLDRSNSVRSFETIWSAHLPVRSGVAVFYHPNGFLPSNLLEYPTDMLVFSEDSFADQLIQSMAGHHASLLSHFWRATCLFLGLSLNDGTLRHLLRQSAVINPGHYHYYVSWRQKGAGRDPVAEAALRESNLEVYNLVTLFLDDAELAALGRLITMPETDLSREAEELGIELKYVYYLTGPIGAGKTTCLSYFGAFKTYEEWTEERPAALGKAWNDLDEQERLSVDAWIIRQFYLRNSRLLEGRTGIHIVDRSPLDPLSFADEADVAEKANAIRAGLSPGKSKRHVESGHGILLLGNAEDMEARIVGRHKKSTAFVIEKMQSQLLRIFPGNEVSKIDTHGRSITDVVKRVGRVILFDEYKPLDLSERLQEIAKKWLEVEFSGSKDGNSC